MALAEEHTRQEEAVVAVSLELALVGVDESKVMVLEPVGQALEVQQRQLALEALQ